MDFTHMGMRFNIIHLPSRGRIQVWLKVKESPWEFGHGKDVPSNMPVREAMQHAWAFLVGKLDHARYNDLLPGD